MDKTNLNFNLNLTIDNPKLLIGLITAENVLVSDAPPDLKDLIDNNIINKLKSQNNVNSGIDGIDGIDAKYKTAIRKLLKEFGFKPTGRNKPASEYLFQSVLKNQEFFYINNVVDINNYVSLYSQLPISTIDLDNTSKNLEIRAGLEGEKYVFNTSGQSIDLKHLLCVCDIVDNESCPIANPIKDSMQTKIQNETSNILGVVYASKEVISDEELIKVLEVFDDCLRKYAKATHTKIWTL
jgi:DNA/RNA-binding domain of Phe-tRNA-synthetase-like protein